MLNKNVKPGRNVASHVSLSEQQEYLSKNRCCCEEFTKTLVKFIYVMESEVGVRPSPLVTRYTSLRLIVPRTRQSFLNLETNNRPFFKLV